MSAVLGESKNLRELGVFQNHRIKEQEALKQQTEIEMSKFHEKKYKM